MLSRTVKFVILGAGTAGGAVALQQNADVDSWAVVRLARAGSTAVSIGRTYKKLLYSQNWDRESPEYHEVKKEAHKIGAQKLLDLCKSNKGVYIKVGQHVGALDYLLPSEYVHTMRVLHKDAPKNTVDELYAVIKEELKKDVSFN